MRTEFWASLMLMLVVTGCAVADKKYQSTDSVNSEALAFKFTVVPDKDDPDSSDVFVDGMIGDKPYRFRLDTGAGRSSVSSDEFTAGFKVVGKKTGAGAFAKVHDDLIEVPQVRVGTLSQSPATMTRTLKDAHGRANLLGMDFMKHYALHFRYDNNSVHAIDSQKPVSNELDLFLGANGHPYVDLTWTNGVQAKGVWDTGAGITLFDAGFVKKHPELFTRAGSSIGTDSSGTTQETPVYLMKGFNLGGNQFPATRVVVIDLSVPNSTIKTPMDFIIGYNVQKRANWIFDFPRKKWAITKMLE